MFKEHVPSKYNLLQKAVQCMHCFKTGGRLTGRWLWSVSELPISILIQTEIVHYILSCSNISIMAWQLRTISSPLTKVACSNPLFPLVKLYSSLSLSYNTKMLVQSIYLYKWLHLSRDTSLLKWQNYVTVGIYLLREEAISHEVTD